LCVILQVVSQMNLDVGVDSVYHLLGSVTDVLTAKIVLMKKIVSYFAY
jgi:hypothetical protein